MLAFESIGQHQALDILEHNPKVLEGSLITKEAAAVKRDVNDLLSSASRIIKSASLENIEFLERVPEDSRNSVWDLAILNAASKIARKTI